MPKESIPLSQGVGVIFAIFFVLFILFVILQLLGVKITFSEEEPNSKKRKK